MAEEDVHMHAFVNAVQTQQLEQLQKAHKAEVQKLTRQKQDFEQKANEMAREMQQQMEMLQNMALTRIEQLEQELMAVKAGKQ